MKSLLFRPTRPGFTTDRTMSRDEKTRWTAPFASLRRYKPDQVLRVWSQIDPNWGPITPSECAGVYGMRRGEAITNAPTEEFIRGRGQVEQSLLDRHAGRGRGAGMIGRVAGGEAFHVGFVDGVFGLLSGALLI